jgi:hypothetical protein
MRSHSQLRTCSTESGGVDPRQMTKQKQENGGGTHTEVPAAVLMRGSGYLQIYVYGLAVWLQKLNTQSLVFVVFLLLIRLHTSLYVINSNAILRGQWCYHKF